MPSANFVHCFYSRFCFIRFSFSEEFNCICVSFCFLFPGVISPRPSATACSWLDDVIFFLRRFRRFRKYCVFVGRGVPLRVSGRKFPNRCPKMGIGECADNANPLVLKFKLFLHICVIYLLHICVIRRIPRSPDPTARLCGANEALATRRRVTPPSLPASDAPSGRGGGSSFFSFFHIVNLVFLASYDFLQLWSCFKFFSLLGYYSIMLYYFYKNF